MDLRRVVNELEVVHQWYTDMIKELEENKRYLEGFIMELLDDE